MSIYAWNSEHNKMFFRDYLTLPVEQSEKEKFERAYSNLKLTANFARTSFMILMIAIFANTLILVAHLGELPEIYFWVLAIVFGIPLAALLLSSIVLAVNKERVSNLYSDIFFNLPRYHKEDRHDLTDGQTVYYALRSQITKMKEADIEKLHVTDAELDAVEHLHNYNEKLYRALQYVDGNPTEEVLKIIQELEERSKPSQRVVENLTQRLKEVGAESETRKLLKNTKKAIQELTQEDVSAVTNPTLTRIEVTNQ